MDTIYKHKVDSSMVQNYHRNVIVLKSYK